MLCIWLNTESYNLPPSLFVLFLGGIEVVGEIVTWKERCSLPSLFQPMVISAGQESFQKMLYFIAFVYLFHLYEPFSTWRLPDMLGYSPHHPSVTITESLVGCQMMVIVGQPIERVPLRGKPTCVGSVLGYVVSGFAKNRVSWAFV